MPGSRIGPSWLAGIPAGIDRETGGYRGGVMTWFSLLVPVRSRMSVCHVRLRHVSSAALLIDSRRDHPDGVTVGDDSRLPWFGE